MKKIKNGLSTIVRICPSCEKEFVTNKNKPKKYCSDKCKSERNEKYMMYNCDCCGKEIRIKKTIYQELIDGKRKHVCCSKECGWNVKHTGHNVTCEYCGKEFYRRQYHIDKANHQFCSNECAIKFRHEHSVEIRHCEQCGKEFECIQSSSQRFCCIDCHNEFQKTLIGEKSPKFSSVLVPCDYCGNLHYVKQSKLKNERHFCSTKCRQDWYSNVFSQSEEWKQESRERQARMLKENKFSFVETKPQLIMNDILKKNNISYKREEVFGFYALDNYLIDYNLMIEVQGDYWHCNPNIFKDKMNNMQFHRITADKAKHTYIKNFYKIEILYVWESELIQNPDLCESLILKYIHNKGNLDNYQSFNYILKNNRLELKNDIVIPYQDMDVRCYNHLLNKENVAS